jgi:hypothetical protein
VVRDTGLKHASELIEEPVRSTEDGMENPGFSSVCKKGQYHEISNSGFFMNKFPSKPPEDPVRAVSNIF